MIASIYTPPWDSVYMLFLIPGLIGWGISVVLWLRHRDRLYTIIIQVLFAIEVFLGSLGALAMGIRDMAYTIRAAGAYDFVLYAEDHSYMATIVIIGWALHLAMLGISGTLALCTYRKNSRAEPGAAQPATQPGDKPPVKDQTLPHHVEGQPPVAG